MQAVHIEAVHVEAVHIQARHMQIGFVEIAKWFLIIAMSTVLNRLPLDFVLGLQMDKVSHLAWLALVVHISFSKQDCP